MAIKKVSPQTHMRALKIFNFLMGLYVLCAFLFFCNTSYKLYQIHKIYDVFSSITSVTPTAVPILNKFAEYGNKIRGKDFKMPKVFVGFDLKWGMLPGEPNAIGICHNSGPTPIIALNKEFWDDATPLVREELLFHELGHCVLNREHAEASARAPQPSIMVPNILPEEDYKAFRNEYILELFTKCDISKLINL